MSFRNENTFYRAALEGNDSAVHAAYEKAVEKLSIDLTSTKMNYPNHIDGGARFSSSQFEDRSPIDESIILGLFQNGSVAEVEKAVEAAKGAFPLWSQIDFIDRVRVFDRAIQIMRKRKYALAAAITMDNGKNRYEAVADVDEAIDFMEYYAADLRSKNGFEVPTDPPYPDERTTSLMRPYGVWAVICPFNFPLAISCGMTTGALITGNTVVLKPSSTSPLPVYMLYEILAEAGLPDGVLNFISGPGSKVGDALTNHPEVEGIVFTGSRSVGLEIMRESLKRRQRPVIAEMGSKNATIVTEEADLEEAIAGVAASAFGYSGQKCSATSRLYVFDSICDEMLEGLVEKGKKLKVGDPRDKDTYLGPVISRKVMDQYLEYSALAAKDGRIVFGGLRDESPKLSRGYYVLPTIVTELPEDHFLMKNELFVPFLCVQRVSDLEEAVVKANDTQFGLTAGIFSRDEFELKYFFANIRSGVVYSNRKRGASTGAMVGGQPFGGWKASGSSGIGTGGPYYLTQFVREQARTVVE